MNFIYTIKTYPRQFWLLNVVQTVERLAYWIVLLQMPVYIAQKDIAGGLHWEHTVKGLIFFWWALVQNISPVLTGGFADRYGRKKLMFISSVLIVAGFILLGNFRTFYPFLFSTLILGLGMGVFKPALQGQVSKALAGKNTAFGWGIYMTFVNIAYFLGPTFSVYLKGFSWKWVFYGSATVYLLNFILLLLVKEDVNPNTRKPLSISEILNESANILRQTVRNIMRPEVLIFLLLITGFTINHMQFYETLPNFVLDWSDTSAIAAFLPQFMQYGTARGTMISFEWIYNINSTMLVLFVAFASWITARRNILFMCALGMLLVSLGLFTAGFTMNGGVLIAGVFVLAIGEITITPRISEYLSSIAPDDARSLYLGYANLAWAFGLSGGGIIGGIIYKNFGEKSALAMQYLAEKYPNIQSTHANAIELLMQKTGLNAVGITDLLWHTYSPWLLWLPFLCIGIAGTTGLIFFARKMNKNS